MIAASAASAGDELFPGIPELERLESLGDAKCSYLIGFNGYATSSCIVALDRIQMVADGYRQALTARGWQTHNELSPQVTFEKLDDSGRCVRIDMLVLTEVHPISAVGAENGVLSFSSGPTQPCSPRPRDGEGA